MHQLVIENFDKIWISLLCEPGIKVTDVSRFFKFFLFKINYVYSDFYLYKLEIFMFKIWRCAVAQLVEVLHYKPEGRGIGSRWDHLDISLT